MGGFSIGDSMIGLLGLLEGSRRVTIRGIVGGLV